MKLTQAKVDANRANAQYSTGPKSAEGKAASARNATRHGLTSGILTILPNENAAELHQLIQDLNAEFQPSTKTEQFLVDQMTHARWKLLRVRRLEAEALDHILDQGEELANPDAGILETLESRGNLLEKLDRYAASAERAYSRAVRDLTKLRADAQKSAKQNEAKQAEGWLYAQLAKLQNEPIGGPPFPEFDPTIAPPSTLRPLGCDSEPHNAPPTEG